MTNENIVLRTQRHKNNKHEHRLVENNLINTSKHVQHLDTLYQLVQRRRRDLDRDNILRSDPRVFIPLIGFEQECAKRLLQSGDKLEDTHPLFRRRWG